MDQLEASLLEAPIVEKDGYHYFVHPISDGIPRVDPQLLREVAVQIVRVATLEDVDRIVTPAAMGIHISTAVSLATDIPMTVIRKREYGLDGEVEIAQQTGYSENEMYINDVRAGERVLVIDDVLSTGGTLAAVLEALEEIGAEVVDTVAVIEKVGDENEVADAGYDVETLIQVDVVDGEVVIVEDEG
ncbi:hypoxanthine/guanine phosphoribosyltransferase [Natrialbaceae archaeon AArc-T1-2]|uniref:hypoxanthine/guanine phosphoribosyltransferase n=1 Tax=Natrialbaceae archaeon AArc-T1-2 TaxID=3053904 RepID=UPI00255AE1F3|nr:hypoxanthine/guanine phosphoribosyltransferase [Natrialbaceae archaeon AArc-T1-2]WIV68459.1 hypoxanthine/guanine phosphoribosyltransferase [Natrialbaceae archaeon AArc-T1-2]